MAVRLPGKWPLWAGIGALIVLATVPRLIRPNAPGPAARGGAAASPVSDAPRSPSAPAVAGRSCSCPTLPVVATSKDPAAGHVYFELRDDDLEAIFSNRDVRYAGSWDQAFAALAHDIDPQRRLGIGGNAAPPTYKDAPQQEGGLSALLIGGHPPAPRSRVNRWANTTGAATITTALLATIARANKYGDPEFRLRDEALKAARFLINDLSAVPPDAALGDRAMLIRSQAFEARRVVIDALHDLTPMTLAIDIGGSAEDERLRRVTGAKRRGAVRTFNGPAPRNGDTVLPLDAFDMADAALDVMLSAEETGATSRMLPREDDRARVVDALVDVASGRRVFGGSAVPDSLQDAIACKAFNTLVSIAAADAAGADVFRNELLAIWNRWGVLALGTSPEAEAAAAPLNAAHASVAAAAIVLTGAASNAEAEALANSTFDVTLAAGTLPNLDSRIAAMKTFETALAGPRRQRYAGVVAARYAERFESLERRQLSNTGSPEERHVLDRWKAAAIDAGAVASGRSPGSPPPLASLPIPGAPCTSGTCDAFSDPPLVASEDFEDRPALIVYSAARRRADGRLADTETVGALSRDEPFFVELRVAEARAEQIGSSPQVTLRSSQTGRSATLTLDKRLPLSAGPVVYMNTRPATLGASTAGPTPDDRLKGQIEQALQSRGLRGLSVQVQNGVVTLGGGPLATSDRAAAFKMAAAVDGVHYVINAITTTADPAGPPSPSEAEAPAPYPLGPPINLPTVNGDTVTVSFGDTSNDFEAYDDPVQLTIAQNDRSFEAVKVMFDAVAAAGGPGGAAAGPAIERKLRVIENARRIIHGTPNPRFRTPYNEFVRADIGTAYLSFIATDPNSWDQTPGSCRGDTPKGDDPRFPGVSYLSCEEHAMVERVLASSKERMDALILHHLAGLATGAYRLYTAAACFELAAAGAPLCPEDFWMIIEGTDATGERVSMTQRVFAGANAVLPVLVNRLTPRVRAFLQEQFAASRSTIEPAEPVTHEMAHDASAIRRSEELAELGAAAKGSPARVEVIGATVDLAEVHVPVNQNASIEGSRVVMPAGQLPRFTARGEPMLPGKFLLQVNNDTCVFTVAEWFRRKAGLPPRSEATNILLSYERGRFLKGGIYTPGERGVTTEAFRLFMEREGATVFTPREANLLDIERALLKGRQVTVAINNGTVKKPIWHQIVVEEIVHGPNGHQVIYGDPANGNFWSVDACAFRGVMNPRDVVYVSWKRKR